MRTEVVGVRFYFWQHMLNPHEAGYIKSLAAMGFKCTVIFQIDLLEERRIIGVERPDYGGADLIHCPVGAKLPAFAVEPKKGDVHFFTGIRPFNLTKRAYFSLKNFDFVKLILISESRRQGGFYGFLRRVSSILFELGIKRRIDAVLAMGDLGVKWFESVGYSPNKIFEFSYSINNLSCPKSDNNQRDLENFRFIFVGQLILRKNVALVLEAFASLPSNYHLTIVGDGPERNGLEKKSYSLGIESRVTFEGAIKNRLIPDKLIQHDALILPSAWDGWGAVVNEALSVGLPCIVSDKCGAYSVLNSGSGFTFRSNDRNDLISKLVAIGHNVEFYRSQRNEIIERSALIGGLSVGNYIIEILNFLLKGTARPKQPWFDISIDRRRVALIYDYMPHYRRPVFSALRKSVKTIEYYADSTPFAGIKAVDKFDLFYNEARVLRLGKFSFQMEAFRFIFGNYDVIIFLANPYNVSTWIVSRILKALGRRVIFWGHCYLNDNDSKLKNAVKSLYFGGSSCLYVYGERAKQIGSELYARKIYVGYNSLDVESQIKIRDSLGPKNYDENILSILCISRLTAECDYDLLVDALRSLKADHLYSEIRVEVVGEGDMRDVFENSLKLIGVSYVFHGAIYDDKVLGLIFHRADMVVSPGKIGLTCMHALAFGVPVISHSEMNKQMPEAEAIIDGVTGTLFERGNAKSLANAIYRLKSLLNEKGLAIYSHCTDIISSKYNPSSQVSVMLEAINDE